MSIRITSVLILSVLVGCGPDSHKVRVAARAVLDSNPSISGKLLVTDSSSLSSLNLGKAFSQKGTSTGQNCSSPQAHLYKIDENGNRIEPALSTVSLNTSGAYRFSLKDLGLKFKENKPESPLLVVVSGCSTTHYSRPVTSSSEQNISIGSTLLSYVINTPEKNRFSDAFLKNTNKAEYIIQKLEAASSLNNAFLVLNSDSRLAANYRELFTATPASLQTAAPEILDLVVPSIAQEKSTVNLSTVVFHWREIYKPVYEWKIDDAVIGRTATVSYALNGNTQGRRVVSLTVGADDGSGLVDTQQPHKTITKVISVNNNVLPNSPTFTLTNSTHLSSVTPLPVHSRLVELTIETGENRQHCESFTALAINENNPNPPHDSSFTIACNTEDNQKISFTLTSPNDGLKTLRLWAKDSAGVVSKIPTTLDLRLDTMVPTVSILVMANSVSNSTTQTFLFSGDDGVSGGISRYECQLDFSDWTICSSPINYTSLSEGTHTFSVRAIDLAENSSQTASQTWNIDITPPSLVITSHPPLLTNSISAAIGFNVNDSNGSGIGIIQCNLNATSWVDCTTLNNFILGSGSHQIQARVFDIAGNVSTTQSFAWTVDTTAPIVNISGKPASITNSQNGIFIFSATENGGGAIASFECALDGGAFTACSSPKSLTGLTAGSHTVQIRAIDTAGNIGLANSYSWVIDLTTPEAFISSNPVSITNQTNATFTFSANTPPDGAIIGYECKLNTATWSACSSPQTYSSLQEGQHTFFVRSIDNNNNVSTPVSYSWSLDTTNPVVSISSTPTMLNNSTVASFTFAASDSGGGMVIEMKCKLDSEVYSTCSSPMNISSLAQGIHTYSIIAIDAAGNASSAQPYTWNVDTTPPALAFSSTPNLITNQTTASFSFSAVDTGGGSIATYTCSLNGGPATTCTSPLNYPSLSPTVNTLSVFATDTAGNSSAPTIYTWTVDTSVPTISITSTPNLLTNATSGNISFSSNDSGGGVVAAHQCKLNGGVFTNCNSPYTFSGLTQGNHTFFVQAIDSAGNISSIQSYSWTIDTTLPTLSISNPSNNGTILQTSALSTFSISGSCSEDGGSVDLSGSFTATIPCIGSSWSKIIDLTGLNDGTLSITANHTDVAGNTVTVTRSVIKDTVAPSISITTPLALKGSTTTGALTWSLTDTNISTDTNFSVEIFDGTTWSTVGQKTALAGNNSNHSYTLSNFTVPSVDTFNGKVRISINDAAGNQKQQESSAFLIQSTAPAISSLTLNNGAPSTYSSFIFLALSASDTFSNIQDFCFKVDTATPPSDSDICWTAVNSPQPNITPDLNISFSNYNMLMSYVSGPHTIYAWVRNMAGLKNTQTSASIQKLTPVPPVVEHILVSNLSSPADPPLVSEKRFNGAQSAYIKWKATSSSNLNIKLTYQTNSASGIIADNLMNGSNGGCVINDLTTADDQDTGCFIWTTPPTEYFTVSVVATDSENVSASNTSYPINANNINVLAGNTDLGIGTTATSAILNVAGSWTDPGSFIVTTDGRMFYRDRVSGLLMVSPTTGNVTRILPITGTASGDGGPVTTATLCGAQKIALDFSDNVLIFDCNKIRKINTNTNPMTISTIIGGGVETTDGTTALNFDITSLGTQHATPYQPKTIPFFATPNGNIYFASSAYDSTIAGGYKIRYYSAADGKIYSITPSGIGHSEDVAADITTKAVFGFGVIYNPLNSAFTKMHLRVSQAYVGDGGFALVNLDPLNYIGTSPHPMKSNRNDYYIQGMNGQLYIHDARLGLIRRFNEGTGTWTTIVGGGSNVNCPDGVLATTCKINNGFTAADAFITNNGQVYYLDANGIVRIVMNDGTVRAILGQKKWAGDGGPAVLARMSNLSQVDQGNDGTIFVSDTLSSTIRQFSMGSNISLKGSAVNGGAFMLNRSTNDLYSINGGSVVRMLSNDTAWTTIESTSSTYSGVANSAITSSLGYDDASEVLYITAPAWNQTQSYHGFKLATFDTSVGGNNKLMTSTSYTNTVIGQNICSNGTLASNCIIPYVGFSRIQYDTTTTPARWLMLQKGFNRVVALNKGGISLDANTTMTDFAVLPRSAVSFVYRTSGGSQIIDYCGTDGKLYSHNLTTNTGTAYPWDINSLTCIGTTLNYNASRNSLIFPASQNGLGSVIEYILAP